jgi:hypothetical protein
MGSIGVLHTRCPSGAPSREGAFLWGKGKRIAMNLYHLYVKIKGLRQASSREEDVM